MDYGIITDRHDAVTKSISLMNTGAEPVSIVGAFLSTTHHSRNGGRRGSSSKRQSRGWKKSNTRLTFMENSVLPVGKEISDVVSLKINGKVEGIYSGNVIIMTNDTNPAQARVEIGYKVRILHGGISVPSGHNNFGLLGGGALRSKLYIKSKSCEKNWDERNCV